MKAVQNMLLVLVSLAAISAVASAYDPIADRRIPSPKFPVKPEPVLSSRKLLQDAARASAGERTERKTKPNVMWGGFMTVPTTTRKMLQQNAAKTVAGAHTMTNANRPNEMFGAYVVTTPYWVAGMGRDKASNAADSNPMDKRFSMSAK